MAFHTGASAVYAAISTGSSIDLTPRDLSTNQPVQSSGSSHGTSPDLAVDGDTGRSHPNQWHADQSIEGRQNIRVKLKAKTTNPTVTLYARNCCTATMQNVNVMIGDKPALGDAKDCGSITDITDSSTTTITCNGKGTYLWLLEPEQADSTYVLNIPEFVVMGVPDKDLEIQLAYDAYKVFDQTASSGGCMDSSAVFRQFGTLGGTSAKTMHDWIKLSAHVDDTLLLPVETPVTFPICIYESPNVPWIGHQLAPGHGMEFSAATLDEVNSLIADGVDLPVWTRDANGNCSLAPAVSLDDYQCSDPEFPFKNTKYGLCSKRDPGAVTLSSEGSNSCTLGSIVSQDECLAQAQSAIPDGVSMERTSLVAGSWAQVPAGCSVQSGGDWAAHFNTNAQGSNDGSYSLVCTEACNPWPPGHSFELSHYPPCNNAPPPPLQPCKYFRYKPGTTKPDWYAYHAQLMTTETSWNSLMARNKGWVALPKCEVLVCFPLRVKEDKDAVMQDHRTHYGTPAPPNHGPSMNGPVQPYEVFQTSDPGTSTVISLSGVKTALKDATDGVLMTYKRCRGTGIFNGVRFASKYLKFTRCQPNKEQPEVDECVTFKSCDGMQDVTAQLTTADFAFRLDTGFCYSWGQSQDPLDNDALALARIDGWHSVKDSQGEFQSDADYQAFASRIFQLGSTSSMLKNKCAGI